MLTIIKLVVLFVLDPTTGIHFLEDNVVIRDRLTVRKLDPRHFLHITVQHKHL